ncbi:MAG: helix-turn-helix domain-containing protein [Isosphaeraceae bacterium]
MARPTKINLERVLRLFAALAEGDTIAEAARAAGIGPATAYRWRAKGKAGDPRYEPIARVFGAAAEARQNAKVVGFVALPLIRTLIRRGL